MKLDPQLQAIRQAAKEKFLAQKAQPSPTGLPPSLAHLRPEQLDAPIGSLLADAEEYRPRKQPRKDLNAIVIPREGTALIQELLTQPAPRNPRVLTWNIDGLDEVGGGAALAQRVLAVALEVAKQRPMAVLLQEVIPPALELLSSEKVLGSVYEVLVPRDPPLPYYVAMLIEKRLKRGEPETMPFPSTQMGRQLLAVTVEHPELPPMLLATAHLESTKDHGAERKRQLLQCLRFLRRKIPKDGPGSLGLALLAGDLNLRDDEVRAVQKELGESIFGDAWSYLGAPEAQRWTWDTTVNSNVGASFACKTRFDRVLFLSPGVTDCKGSGGLLAKPKEKLEDGWHPTAIQLLGKEKVPGLGRFPSDHWGVLTEWSYGPKAILPIAASTERVCIDLDA